MIKNIGLLEPNTERTVEIKKKLDCTYYKKRIDNNS